MFFTEETGSGSDSGGGGNPVFGEESMPEDVRLLGSSEVGYSEIYRAKIDGKFVVLKSLKPELRGIPMYEHLLHKEYEIGYDLDHRISVRSRDSESLSDWATALSCNGLTV